MEITTKELLYFRELCNMDDDEIDTSKILKVNELFHYIVILAKVKLKLSVEGVYSVFGLNDMEFAMFCSNAIFTRTYTILDEMRYEQILLSFHNVMQMGTDKLVSDMAEQFNMSEAQVKQLYFELD